MSRPFKPQTLLKSNNIFVSRLLFLSPANNNKELHNILKRVRSNVLPVIKKLFFKFSKLQILLNFQADTSFAVKTNIQINADINNYKKVSVSFFSTNNINKKMISAATCSVEIPNTLTLVDKKPIAIQSKSEINSTINTNMQMHSLIDTNKDISSVAI